jgi:hypothetical protein
MESGVGTYLSQYREGPARGIARIEEPTFSWLKDLTSTRYQSIGTKLFQLFGEPEHDQLSARLDLSVALPVPLLHRQGANSRHVGGPGIVLGTVLPDNE